MIRAKIFSSCLFNFSTVSILLTTCLSCTFISYNRFQIGSIVNHMKQVHFKMFILHTKSNHQSNIFLSKHIIYSISWIETREQYRVEEANTLWIIEASEWIGNISPIITKCVGILILWISQIDITITVKMKK